MTSGDNTGPMEGVAPTPTVAALLRARADDQHLGLLFEDQAWTWEQIVDESEKRARLLSEVRRPGPFHVGVLLENVPEYIFLLGAAALSGAVIVGINPTRRGRPLAEDIAHTDCQLILTDSAQRSALDGLEIGVPEERVWDVNGAPYSCRVADMAGSGSTAAVRPDDLYLLLFTSGSSGAPKAVRMTHRRAVRASQSMLCSREDVPYCAMPLFHGNALNANFLPALSSGATMALRRKFSASAFLPDVRRYGCSYFSTIGRVLNFILATPEQVDDTQNSLEFVLAPESSAADMAEFERRYGCAVFSGYGSSENAIILHPAPGVSKSALGVAPEGQDVAIVDQETSEECPRAEFDEHDRLVNAAEAIGEIVGRNSLSQFEGYYRNDQAMSERSRNGWYWSGDLGYRDEAGVFWFAGRTADWIRVDGENFATAPIEPILGRFDGVRAVAVYGVPDERNAEDQVMASLELSPDAQFDFGAFEIFLTRQPDLGPKWIPRYLRLTRLPVTATAKIDKLPLRSEAWNTPDEVFWRADRRAGYQQMTDEDVAALHATMEENGLSHRIPAGE